MLKEELYENLFPVTNAALNGKVKILESKSLGVAVTVALSEAV